MTPPDGADSSARPVLARSDEAPPETPSPGSWPGGLEARHLRALVALVDTGSMTAASRALGVAQSTVSETIAALDRLLGAATVRRRSGAREVELTTVGNALIPHARRVLAALDEAQLAVMEVSRDARDSVAVVANESLSTYLLPQALSEARGKWPRVRFTVTVATCAAVREGVSQGRYELGLALRARGPAQPDAQVELLAEVRLALFAPAAHPLLVDARAAIDRAELAPYPIFSSDSAGEFHALLNRFFDDRTAGSSRSGSRSGSRFETVGSVEAVKRSVRAARLALGVLPAYAIAAELESGELRALPLHPPLPRMRLEASFGTTRPVSPASAGLVEALRAALARHRRSRAARNA